MIVFFGGFYWFGAPAQAFMVALLAQMAMNPPKLLISPKSMLLCYYLLWYAFPLNFSDNYTSMAFEAYDQTKSIIFVFVTFQLGYFVTSFPLNFKKSNFSVKGQSPRGHIWVSAGLMAAFLMLYVLKTGGVSRWILEGGRNFLYRQGAGLFYLGFIFSLNYMLICVGFLSHRDKKRGYLALSFLLVGMLSVFIGSKIKILLSLLCLGYPFLYEKKFLTIKNIKFIGLAAGIVVVLFALRYRGDQNVGAYIQYITKYFNTYEALLISVRDIEPQPFMTFFLPFNKISNLLFGTDLHYDLSLYLTSIYYSTHYSINATVQWPIETDMYLNFGYWFGLPVLALFFALYNMIFFFMISRGNLGGLFFALNIALYFMGHLRSSVIYWTDFYYFPALLGAYVLLCKIPLVTQSQNFSKNASDDVAI
ncbi:MAG: hypothetical protein R3A11_05330 [Bdellovibrionota bacterium]